MKNLTRKNMKTITIISFILLLALFLPIKLAYASAEEIKPIDLEKWYGLMVFREVEVREGNTKHEKMITEENTMSVEELKSIYSNEELYTMIESNLYQTIEYQKMVHLLSGIKMSWKIKLNMNFLIYIKRL